VSAIEKIPLESLGEVSHPDPKSRSGRQEDAMSNKNKPASPLFLLLFKDGDEITRRQVYSYPALHRLMKMGMIKFRKGPTYDEDIYRITEAGKELQADVIARPNAYGR
jgi:hypothetical protein